MLAVGAFALAAVPSAARTSTLQMPVSVRVTNACTIFAAPLVFNVPVPLNANVDSTSSITVRCLPNVAYTIDIDDGQQPNGGNRRVLNAAANDTLVYQVYKDPPHSQVWGRGNLKQVTGNTGVTGTVVHVVYGRLSAKASMKAGSYRDLLTITMNF
jgi:spore coat protein U-like protein